ncbi:1-acyl-sn-glycerol-3-phosphate acyltransferase [Polynucleobacter hirudinilacicola]|uniref:1-acyl-sn-glycerol-3-phosphate acyltransferase n=1 Tax=Polynucleobacter hirudinilacicola TaxID=1743166 RepID=A0A210RXP5_9BURK|nr:lysophospholipid acyltransferase family protein [Polynucleobacter hirudinilacicola]OWF65795.1 1-acyl-sn-glycerol-3-phosphate acyltransferase [Polynucleobacter hirudinilacicola]
MTHTIQPSQRATPFLLYITLWFLVWLHVLRGAMTLLVLFPFLNANGKKQHIQRWSKRLLKIFGIQLQVNNVDALTDSSCLLAANHVSWMDIHAINAFKPIRFVAKSEVERWPIFGWMAKQLGTVFINRESSRHARQVVTDMAVLLKTQSICIFPEGTSTIGKSVQTFKPNLFEAAAQAEVPVCTLALAYFDQITGEHSEVPAFIGDMGLIGSMASILKNRRLRVVLTFFSPIKAKSGQALDRKGLALHSQEQIAQYLAKNCN